MVSKVSIACLFFRLFSTRWVRLTLKIFIAFLCSHGIALILVVILQCWPVNSIWDPTAESKCLNVMAIGLADAGIGMSENLVLIAVAATELRKLRATRYQRASLTASFAVAML